MGLLDGEPLFVEGPDPALHGRDALVEPLLFGGDERQVGGYLLRHLLPHPDVPLEGLLPLLEALHLPGLQVPPVHEPVELSLQVAVPVTGAAELPDGRLVLFLEPRQPLRHAGDLPFERRRLLSGLFLFRLGLQAFGVFFHLPGVPDHPAGLEDGAVPGDQRAGPLAPGPQGHGGAHVLHHEHVPGQGVDHVPVALPGVDEIPQGGDDARTGEGNPFPGFLHVGGAGDEPRARLLDPLGVEDLPVVSDDDVVQSAPQGPSHNGLVPGLHPEGVGDARGAVQPGEVRGDGPRARRDDALERHPGDT